MYYVNAVVIFTVIAIVFFDAVMNVTVLIVVVDVSNPLMTIVVYRGEKSSLSADVTPTT